MKDVIKDVIVSNSVQMYSDKIWSILNTKQNHNKCKVEQLKLIEPIVFDMLSHYKRFGEQQVFYKFYNAMDEIKEGIK